MKFAILISAFAMAAALAGCYPYGYPPPPPYGPGYAPAPGYGYAPAPGYGYAPGYYSAPDASGPRPSGH
jgi:hypothetical protein